MKPYIRTIMVATASAHAQGKKVSSVYDYAGSGYSNISVSISAMKVDGYDYSRGCHFGGTLPSLYDYGDGHHITLKPEGNGKYSGYDYATGSHFTIEIKNKSVSLYDYETGSYYSFTV